jgi:hypothetical protein
VGSQRSARGRLSPEDGSWTLPTAVQARSPEQETALSAPFGTFGLGWIDQRVPFHSSTSGVVPELEVELPTAKQTFACGHETPFSELKVVPGGLGVGTICQLAPSQRSASGPPVGGVEMKITGAPTAMHELADEQSTAFSVVNEAPSTFGVGVTVQAADATEGVSNSAAVANKTRRNGRSDIRTATLRRGHALVKRHQRPLGSQTVSQDARTQGNTKARQA